MRGACRLLRILQALAYISTLGPVVAPVGFVTDGASIPRIFWAILGPHGSYFAAAIIHDFLYSARNTTYTRRQADQIFLEAMKDCGVGLVKRQVIFRAVRIGGAFAFKGGPRG